MNKFERHPILYTFVISLLISGIFIPILFHVLLPYYKENHPSNKTNQYEERMIARQNEHIEHQISTVMKGLRFSQHKESGICFAIYPQHQGGYLSEVDCEKVPAPLLR